MTEGQGGFLWRLARLHPAWMALPVIIAFAVNALAVDLLGRAGETGGVEALAAVLQLLAVLGSSLFVAVYAFLVSAMVSGRFHARRSRRLRAPAIAMAVVVAAPLAAVLVLAVPVLSQAREALLENTIGVLYGISTLLVFYLMIRASVELVDAERGFGGGTGRKIGTFLLLGFWLIGVFFVQARIRRLALTYQQGKAIDLPREKLKLVETGSDRLSLILTERVFAEDFDAYGEELIRRLDGHILKKAAGSEGQSWKVEIEGSNFHLLFDSASSRVSLEAREDSAALLLARLQKWLNPATSGRQVNR